MPGEGATPGGTLTTPKYPLYPSYAIPVLAMPVADGF